MAILERPPSKIERVLSQLLQGPRTTRQLEGIGDHVGHSSASELRKKGVSIRAELVEVPGYGGTVARVARYSIPEDGREIAERVLREMRERRRGRG